MYESRRPTPCHRAAQEPPCSDPGDDPDDGWGTPGDGHDPRPAARRDDEDRAGQGGAGDGPRRRWLRAALLAGQVVAGWLDRSRRHPRWLAAAAVGLAAALAVAAGGPAGSLAGGVSNLAFLAGLFRSGSGLPSDLT